MAKFTIGTHVMFKANTWEHSMFGDCKAIVLRNNRYYTTIKIYRMQDGSRTDMTHEVVPSSLKAARLPIVQNRVTWRKANSKKVIL